MFRWVKGLVFLTVWGVTTYYFFCALLKEMSLTVALILSILFGFSVSIPLVLISASLIYMIYILAGLVWIAITYKDEN